MENKLVSYSRAGDVFHYRWAARRCLRMIYPKSPLKCIVIEGSKESKISGEYVIDFSEYQNSNDTDNEKITYFQLKHSTKRKNVVFNLSDLKTTIQGFSKRYLGIANKGSKTRKKLNVNFLIVTNRPINKVFKEGIQAIGNGKTVKKRLRDTLDKYTQFKGYQLKNFCKSIEFIDGEGDYNAQKHELHFEISQLLADDADNDQVDSIIALVQDHVLPDKIGNEITREDILRRFGVTSERDLFPAPSELNNLQYTIKREQHSQLLDIVLKASGSIIIHGCGGVGKSVVAHQLVQSLPFGSIGIVYDCFNDGEYRMPSRPRHRHCDALVQIINKIASDGLCAPLIPRSSDLDDAFLRAFLTRLQAAASILRKVQKDAIIVILIDAADNAEMVAREQNGLCFANQLLREEVPEGCKIVTLCRTERIELLKPSTSVRKVELKCFSESESLAHLRKYYSDATVDDGLEFHRLTDGSPRVQANSTDMGGNTISDIFTSLGPSGTTVDDQISSQLKSAISNVKEVFPPDFQNHVDAICLGLAILPPFIPIEVLSTAAEVDLEAVKSFVADLGRPLWFSDNSVHFRDEPTETWFRKNFSASTQQLESYVTRLKPLASQFSYVAEVLPSLLLQSGDYDQLISLALSDDFLPVNNPIDERNIRVCRLQFSGVVNFDVYFFDLI